MGQTDGQMDGIQHRFCTLAARWHSNYAHSLLVLLAVRRQQRAVYAISAIFER